MASVSYDALKRKLVVEELCWPEDGPGLADAVEAFAEPASRLVVDLSRLPFVPPEVASAVEGARQRAEAQGCLVEVWSEAPADAPAQRRPTTR